MSEKRKRIRVVQFVSLSCFAILLCGLYGCGLLGGSKPAQVKEVPPYLQQGGHVTVPMDHQDLERDPNYRRSQLSSRDELERLQREADAWAEEEARKNAVEAERAGQKKKGFWGWFESGDKTTGMSKEAKEINSGLEQRRADYGLDR